MAGTSLDGKDVAETVAVLHPFTPFADNAQYYDDKQGTTYYANVWSAVIKDFEAHGIVPKGKITADDVVWGRPHLASYGRIQGQERCRASLKRTF